MSLKLLIAGTGYLELLEIANNGVAPTGEEFEVLGFLDDNPENLKRDLLGYKIIGGFSEVCKYPEALVINSISRSTSLREKTTKILANYGAKFTSVIHKTSILNNCHIGNNSFIGPYVVIEPNVLIKENNCILSSSVIAHDSIIKETCFIGYNCSILGKVEVEKRSYIGSSSVILPNSKIGEGSVIGANSTIIRDVMPYSTISPPLSKKIR